jgi:hypothetical protein
VTKSKQLAKQSAHKFCYLLEQPRQCRRGRTCYGTTLEHARSPINRIQMRSVSLGVRTRKAIPGSWPATIVERVAQAN